MSETKQSVVSLESIGARHLGRVYENLSTAALVEDVVRRREGHLSAEGAVAVRQGQRTERSLDTTYLVSGQKGSTGWLVGERVAELSPDHFGRLSERLLAYLQGRDVYVQDVLVGTGEHAPVCRILTETAWHALLARNLYRPRPSRGDTVAEPELTVVHAPGFQAVGHADGLRFGPFTVFHADRRLAYVAGSSYGGELRTAVSSLARAAAPADMLALRGAVSVGPQGDTALFLGRTGTGKTALALDGQRRLLADHAVGWGGPGLRGYERGAYASVLGLDAEVSPALHSGAQQFGSVLENVVLDPTHWLPDFHDARLAVNCRAAFRVASAHDVVESGEHPRHVFLLTRDTVGVLPPIARLTPDQAVFAFLISYTSSLADTEAGQRDVRPDVERALGQAAVAVSPAAYAKRFLERITTTGARCWFVNTGWVGEPADRGARVDLQVTRTLVNAALTGALDDVEMEPDPLFLFEVPRTCEGVDPTLLNPRACAADEAEYEIRANLVAKAFIDAFAHFEEEMPASVAEMVDSVVLFEETLDVMESFRISF